MEHADFDILLFEATAVRLYHGSYYRTSLLQPGFNHTGKETKWDETESNRWLYATTDRTLAIEMGFASSLDQVGVAVSSFSTERGLMHIKSTPIVTPAILHSIKNVYLYTVGFDGFEEVHNKYNNAEGEYKCDRPIKPLTVEAIDLAAFLNGYRISFEHSSFS